MRIKNITCVTKPSLVNSHHIHIIFVKMNIFCEPFKGETIDLTVETDSDSVIDLCNESDSEKTYCKETRNRMRNKKEIHQKGKKKTKNEYNKRRHHVKKEKCRRFQPNEVANLMVSAIGFSREGSTLEHMSKSTFVAIGWNLRRIFNRMNISDLKFLDVGHGHGCGLIDLAYVFGMTAVGLECDDKMFQGSIIHLKRYVQKKIIPDSVYIPYIPLKANGLDLCSLGGAEVLYSWCRGAPPILMEKLYQTFVKDSTCIVLITSEWYHFSILKRDNLRQGAKLNGQFHSGTMVLYFYVKKSQTSCFPKTESKDLITTKIQQSFLKAAQFKKMPKPKKSKEYVQLLIDWASKL